MLLETSYSPWQLARTVSQTSTSFVSKLSTNTEPVTAGTATATSVSIFQLGSPRQFTQNGLLLMPFGTGSDGNTFSVRVLGWAPGVLANATSGVFSWYPTLLCELLCTISSTNVGVANGFTPGGASDYFAKTIALTYGNDNVNIDRVSPGVAGLYASALLSIKGFQKIELTFSTGSSSTDANALVRFQ